METIEQFENEYNRLDAIITSSQHSLSKVAEEYSDKHCPFKKGDKIEIAGYAHRGKTGVIDVIRGSVSHGLDWEVLGDVLKKDGSYGSYRFVFTGSDHEWYLKSKQPIGKIEITDDMV